MASTNRGFALLFAIATALILTTSLSGQLPSFAQLPNIPNIGLPMVGVVTKVGVDSITVAGPEKTTTCSLDGRTPVVDTKGQMVWTQPDLVKFSDLLKTGTTSKLDATHSAVLSMPLPSFK